MKRSFLFVAILLAVFGLAITGCSCCDDPCGDPCGTSSCDPCGTPCGPCGDYSGSSSMPPPPPPPPATR